MTKTWITEEMQALVGREYGHEEHSVPIALADIRKWAIAIYFPEMPPRLFWDEEYAAGTVHGGVVAPEEFNPFAWFTAAGPRMPDKYEGPITGSGPESHFDVAGPGTSFQMAGGTAATYGVRMRPGDVITSGRSKLVGYKEREGRLGLTLYTMSESSWSNQRGELVKTTTYTHIRY